MMFSHHIWEQGEQRFASIIPSINIFLNNISRSVHQLKGSQIIILVQLVDKHFIVGLFQIF